MSEEEQPHVRHVTEEELAYTEEETVRSLSRMIIDRVKLEAAGVPANVANTVTAFRYIPDAAYSIQCMKLNGIETAVVLAQIAPGQIACFAIINDSFTLTDMEGNDVKDTRIDIERRGNPN